MRLEKHQGSQSGATVPGGNGKAAVKRERELINGAREYLTACQQHQPASAEATDAWHEFYATYDPLIRRYAAGFHLDAHQVDDCAQEVWTKLVVKLLDFVYKPRRGRFPSWLFVLVRSQAIKLLRASNRTRTVPLTARLEQELSSHQPDDEPDGDRLIEKKVLALGIADLRRKLPAQHYRLFEMRWIEGGPIAEVAATLKMTVDKARSRDYRVRKSLRHWCVRRWKVEVVEWVNC